MELEGNLASFQLPAVLRFLAMGEMTGTLTLSSEEHSVGLQIQEGRLVGIRSAYRHLKLGELLVYSGIISRRELEDALASQNENSTGTLIGELLLQRKVVTPQQMSNVLQLQIKEELWELFSWRNGSFKFEHGVLKNNQHVTISLEIEPLIAEGTQRMEQYQTIVRSLGAPDVHFRIRSDLKAFPENRLTPGTWRVLSLINGKRSVQTLICLSGLGKFETLCALDTLVGQQIIEQMEADSGNAKAATGAKRKDTTTRPAHGHADAEPDADALPTERGGLRSLLGFGRRPENRTDPVENGRLAVADSSTTAGKNYSSVALACDIVNRLTGALANETGLPRPELKALWEKACIRYPRTDLIGWRDGELDGRPFDRYAMVNADERMLAGVHEDMLGALATTARDLIAQTDPANGDRAWRLAEAYAEPYLKEGATVQWPVDYDIRDWISRWLNRRN